MLLEKYQKTSIETKWKYNHNKKDWVFLSTSLVRDDQ